MTTKQKARLRLSSLSEGATLTADQEISMEQAGQILAFIGFCEEQQKLYQTGKAPKPRTVGLLPNT